MEQFVFVNTDTGIADGDGNVIQVRVGMAFPADDPIVKRMPGIFSDEPVLVIRTGPVEHRVEQATRAPGERRAVRIR